MKVAYAKCYFFKYRKEVKEYITTVPRENPLLIF